ncbi:hypothetical protein PF005_g32399 [Phytophthora fragariae]|uniref:Secreted protein n=1 Tax=Phytophthora fragariae TaxID=53985 RepID=A0A6A3D729_9STRA|nr:hypothetical protein PF003_g32258 [Phytophthora fragariae]KAE8883755.1 hypothetical protein PF003_g32252 [Phytophthora fragariae]KAE8917314.1 hypothetical protein PF009_g32364 [Phytophthora fragariae]KAE8953947.1 hypothetical protein PF011_g32263 [Phytophthora fragariae]KAE9055413.1 hypothetical protein PF006_g32969 [Phytophthora fragariae]
MPSFKRPVYCLHCYHTALLVVTAVLLHRCRPFVSCSSATCSSSATAPIPSISIMLLC